MGNTWFRDTALAARSQLHEQERLLRGADERLSEHHPVAALRSLVLNVEQQCYFAFCRMLLAQLHGRKADVYYEGLTYLIFHRVLVRIVQSWEHPAGDSCELPPQAVEGDAQLDEEGARRMLRAGHNELLRAREAWTTAYRLVREDPDVSVQEREQALAALTGLVDGVFSLTWFRDLKIALENEGVRRGSEEFVYLLSGTLIEALDSAPSPRGLKGIRSKVSGLLRNPRVTEQAKFKANLDAMGPTEINEKRLERELAGFAKSEDAGRAKREDRMNLYQRENRKIARASLSANEYQVFLMARTMSPKKIAEKLGRSSEQVRQELSRARKKRQAV